MRNYFQITLIDDSIITVECDEKREDTNFIRFHLTSDASDEDFVCQIRRSYVKDCEAKEPPPGMFVG